ncbi:hypothetical protein NN561_020120 [Cricetulus griseus]
MCGKTVRLRIIFAALFNKSNLFLKTDTSSGSEDEGSVQGDSQGTPTSSQGSINMEHWISQAIHGSTTSTTSSSSTQSGGSGAAHRLADVMAQTHIENHSAPPDVTTYTSEHSIQVERPQGSTTSRTAPKYGNAELMETGDGVPVSSRVSAKIQQLVNTLKRPKRPPLREFFVDDFEELLEGKLWTRSMKVAYNILHKLGTKQEPMVRPGDRVALVFPNNDPAAFMVAFYGCLLAEVVPVPIEVPLTRKSVMNMMHVISIPYSLMKVNPLSWIQKVCQYKGWSLLGLWVIW